MKFDTLPTLPARAMKAYTRTNRRDSQQQQARCCHGNELSVLGQLQDHCVRLEVGLIEQNMAKVL